VQRNSALWTLPNRVCMLYYAKANIRVILTQ